MFHRYIPGKLVLDLFHHDSQDSNNYLTVSRIRKLGKAYSNRNKLGRKINQNDGVYST